MRKFFQQQGGVADIMLGRSNLTWEEAMAMPHEEGWYDDEDDEYDDEDYFNDWLDETLFDDDDDDDDELMADWEFESENWALILKELFGWDRAKKLGAYALSALAMMALYYPLMRGYCWLVLAAAYFCGTDGSAWPGPYTPYPEHF